MGTRRESRELALQFLYQQDVAVNAPELVAEALQAFWRMHESDPAARAFTQALALGVIERREEIDARIKACAQNWELHRIAAVDRNILRLAIYELLFCEDIPPVVSINEAIDLAKKFSTEDSGRFVNGVLDRVKLELTRPSRTASGTTPAR